MAVPGPTPTTLTNMLDRDDIELHWDYKCTTYTCADLMEVTVRKKCFLLDKKCLLDDTDYLN